MREWVAAALPAACGRLDIYPQVAEGDLGDKLWSAMSDAVARGAHKVSCAWRLPTFRAADAAGYRAGGCAAGA